MTCTSHPPTIRLDTAAHQCTFFRLKQPTVIFDLSQRTQLELTGADRAKFLHGFCTNDIKALTPGRGCEAFVCNVQGKVLGHIFVFCTETSLWIDAGPGQEDGLFQHFDRYIINEDVQIHRRSAEFGDLYLHQTLPSEVFSDLGHEVNPLADEPLLSLVTVNHRQIRRVDWLGETGWLISAPRSELSLAENAMPLSDPDIWNFLRISAGFPQYGSDITSDNLAQEVNRTERCISFKKGCYLGQEPIARIDALGHVNKELHRLSLVAGPVPPSGTALLESAGGPQVGVMTSAASSSGKTAALGYLRTKSAQPGNEVWTADSLVATVL